MIREALETHDGILSLGGGAVTTDGVRAALAGHTVVYLEISAAEGVRRTSGSTVRPLLAGPDRAEKYRELMTARVPLYRRVATIRINTNRRNPGAVVRHIAARLENPASEADKRQPRRRRPSWRRSGSAAAEPASPPVQGPEVPTPAEPVTVTPATLAARREGVRK